MTAVGISVMCLTLAPSDGDPEFLFGAEYEKTHSTTCVDFLCEAARLLREVCAWPIHTSVPSIYKPLLYVNSNKHADGVELALLRRSLLVFGICNS